ncbi:MAG: Crp/Fnr family transcriptional regulator [Planctomycetota bacterium]|jgi:CRP/FNR family transcriptional regulator
MDKTQLISALKSVPAFSALSDNALADLAAACRVRSCRDGEAVFAADADAEAFFLILTGQVKVFRTSPKGDEQILHLYGPGKAFAEAAFWAGGRYPANAQAVSESSLLAVPRRAVEAALAKDPSLAAGMLLGMSRKLQEFADLIDDLSLKEVPARLAGVLLAEAEAAGAYTFELTQTKRQLAARIAAAPETLSRALKKLTDDRLIDVEGPRIALLDVPALRAVHNGGAV